GDARDDGPSGCGRELPDERHELVEARVVERAILRMHERMHGRRPEHEAAAPRARELAQLAGRRRPGAGRVHHREREADAGDRRAEVAGHRRRHTTSIGISTKSRAPSSQRNARASPGVRLSETTTYVTSGYAGSS